MKVSEAENRFQPGFQQLKSGLPQKNGINILIYNDIWTWGKKFDWPKGKSGWK